MLSCGRQHGSVEKALALEQVFSVSTPSTVTLANNLGFLSLSFLVCKIMDNDTKVMEFLWELRYCLKNKFMLDKYSFVLSSNT